MFCRNCGTELDDSASFCFQCGSKVEQKNTNNTSNDINFDSVVKPYIKNNKRKVIIAVVALIAVGVALVGIPKLAKKVAVQQEINKTEKAIEVALNDILDIKDFSCHVDTDATTHSKVDRTKQLNGGYDVYADVTFKDERMHAESGRCYIMFTTANDFYIYQDYSFESYITKDNQVFTAKDDESFESVTTGFAKENLISFFEEVKANYEADMEYESDEESDDIVICGTLAEGVEIYHTYIDFLNLAVAEPDNYPVYGEMNYNLVISKENKAVKSITFYLPDVEHIWLGYGDDGLVVEDSYAEFTITYNELSEVEDFELPYFAQEQEKDFEEMPQTDKIIVSEVLPAYEKYISENLGPNEYSVYNLIYIDEDDIPELLFDNTADGRGTELLYYQNGEVLRNPAPCRGFEFYYIPKSSRVLYIGCWDADAYGTVSYLNNGTLISEHTYASVYDMDTDSYTYSIDDMECTEEDYNSFKDSNMKDMVYGWDTYSSIQEAYENIGNSSSIEASETTTSVLSGEYYGCVLTTTEFTLDNQRLIMKDEENGTDINLKVSEECKWYCGYIQEIVDSSYKEIYELWGAFPHTNAEKYDELGVVWDTQVIEIEVKNGEIVKVLLRTGEGNEDTLLETAAFYHEVLNSY